MSIWELKMFDPTVLPAVGSGPVIFLSLQTFTQVIKSQNIFREKHNHFLKKKEKTNIPKGPTTDAKQLQ